MKRSALSLGCAGVLLATLVSSAVAEPYAPAVRELSERRTQNSRHFLLADGRYKAEFSANPLHYQAGDGSWQPIDTTLGPSTKQGFAAANETNLIRTYLPGGGAGWVRVEAGNTAVAFQPLGAVNGVASSMNNRVNFAGVGNNVSLSYEVQPGRLKETLTLTAPVPTPSFDYALRLEGLTPKLNENNSVSLSDANGVTGLIIEAPWMQDANGRVSTAIRVALTAQGSGFVYSVTPDPAWLANARYPVVIDPSLSPPFVGPGAYASYDYPTSYNVATPNAAVGAIGANQSGAYRTLLQFNASSLPLDAEVDSARLTYFVGTYHLNNNPITIEARDFPFSLSTPSDVKWSTDAQRNNLIIGKDLTPFAAGGRRTYSYWGIGYDWTGLDVTEVVQAWADRRYARNVLTGTLEAAKLNILIHDITDEPNGTGSGNVMYIDTSGAGSGGPGIMVGITYSTPGWYTFQGNRRHTGRTQYAISSTPAQRWLLGLGQPYLYNTPDITPSLIAVPRSDNPDLAIVYAVTSDGCDYSRVSRIQENGDNTNGTQIAPTITSQRLLLGVIHGTPLLYKNVLWVTGTDSLGGFMYALNPNDLTQLAWANSVDHPNPMRFTRQEDGTTYGSVVYSSPTPNPVAVAVPGSSPVRYEYGVIVCANVQAPDGFGQNGSGFDGYLFCKSVNTGLDLWPTSSLTPLTSYDVWDPWEGHYVIPNIFSSPAASSQQVYVATTNAWVNSRDLATGNNPNKSWASVLNYDDMDCRGSVTLFNGRIFGTFQDDDRVAYPSPGGAACLYEQPDHSAADIFSTFEFPANDLQDYSQFVLTTPAVRAETNATSGSSTLIFGDDSGFISGIGTEQLGATGSPAVTWDDGFGGYGGYQTPAGDWIRCSPLVAGAPGGAGYVYVGADDRRIYVLNADTGAYVTRTAALNNIIHSSMAPFKGRLYAITTSGAVYCFR